MTQVTLALNEIHKPSVSFNEVEDQGDLLASSVFNGKVYVTKDFLRGIKFNTQTDVLDITISKRAA